MRVIGEAQQQWAPLRRKYNLFLHRPLSESTSTSDAPQLTSGSLPLSTSKALQTTSPDEETHGFAQFASVDEPFLSWDFSLMSEEKKLIGSVNRNFAGFAREIFTDTGVYALRMDSAGLAAEPGHLISKTGVQAEDQAVAESHTGMTLDQRAVMLATAVSIDFDYFSRHSGASGGAGWMPLWFPWGGGAAGEAGAGGAAEAGGAAGAGEGVAGRGAGEIARDVGVGEGAATGAGGLAGYEAMQRAREGSQQSDDASPTAPGQQGGGDDDFLGGFGGPESGAGGSGSSGNSPAGPGSGEKGGGSGAGDDGGGGGDGGGDGFDFSDFF